eukprot:SAG31_NODE_1772_length_7306_cov_3.341335_5_plen_101_part_00
MAGSTVPLPITGAKLLVTADTDTLLGGGENPKGSPTLDNVGKLAINVEVAAVRISCKALTGANVTEQALEDCDFTKYVGQNATVNIMIDGAALLYMLGFS